MHIVAEGARCAYLIDVPLVQIFEPIVAEYNVLL